MSNNNSNENKEEIDELSIYDNQPFFVNLYTLDSDMKGTWWHRIHSKNFGFLERIPMLKNCKVCNGDILIHKFLYEGDRLPTKRYFVLMDKQAFNEDGREVRKILAKFLAKYIYTYKILPYKCEFSKASLNEVVQIDYSPSKWENYALKLTPSLISTFHIDTILMQKNQISTIEEYEKIDKYEKQNMSETYFKELMAKDYNPLLKMQRKDV
ncbi:MAG: hypothetical protein WC934_06375 [Acidithiobacillus sp.]|jgi:hypothetical protein|uniref:hypothetical protein n=1 Tax=Acidithiobacillus sp. TaxID=1872118 RepID=UPI00355EFA75